MNSLLIDNLKTQNSLLYEKIINLNEENQITYLSKLINLGYVLEKNIGLNVELKDNQYHSKISNLEKQIEVLGMNLENFSKNFDNNSKSLIKLDDTVNILSGNIKNSALKGKIGENFIENTLKNYFNEDIIEVKAKEGHESDIHFSFKEYENKKILIESKFYNVPVNTKQLDKFYYDIERTGVNYAVFVSLGSGIVGINKLHYDFNRKLNCHILYIPNCNFVYDLIIYGLIFFKNMFDNINIDSLDNSANNLSKNNITDYNKHKFVEMNNTLYISEKYYESFLQQINQIICHNFEFWNMISRLRSDIYESKNAIVKILDTLYKNTYDTELKIRYIIDNTNILLNYEFKKLKEKYYKKILEEQTTLSNEFNKTKELENENYINNNDNTELKNNKRFLYELMNSKGYISYNDAMVLFIINYYKDKNYKIYEPLLELLNYITNINQELIKSNIQYKIYGLPIKSSCDNNISNINEIYIIKENINSYKQLCILKINKTKIELEKKDIKILLKSNNYDNIKSYFKILENI